MSERFEGARVLISGGLGFIGSNLAIALVDSGAKVTLVDNLWPEYGGNYSNIARIDGQVRIEIGDVRDASLMRTLVSQNDFFFNLAGQTSHVDSMSNPHVDLEINAAAQLSILEACRSHNPSIRIVFASTRQVYGRPHYLPVDELHPVKPVDVNGVNKLSGESFHVLYQEVYGVRSSVLRLTNTYGPHMRVKDSRQTFLGVWIRDLVGGSPIQVFGDGNQLRDFTYVDDCVEALMLAALSEKAVGKIYNLGGTEVISLGELAALAIGVNGSGDFEFVGFPEERKAIDIGDYYSDFSLFEKEVGWKPRVMLREGLLRTLEYYRSRRGLYW